MTRRGQVRPTARYLVIFATGLFGLAAQTLLFRDFFTVFEGHEIGIGTFFGSWLAWVAIGAGSARGRWASKEILVRRFPLVALLYLPAYLLQSHLTASARGLAGVAVYELFPLGRLLPMSFLVNAPVSFCTGFVFCLACRWMTDGSGQPVSRVYLAEAAGAGAGGIGVTLLLAAGWPGPSMAVLAANILLAAVAIEAVSRRAFAVVVLSILVAAATWIEGASQTWHRHRQVRDWSRFLPAAAMQGSFTTTQARYLYGMHEGQFAVVAWNGVVDALPRRVHASEIVAMHLAQHPRARRFLVVGPGSLAICRRLLDLPDTRRVTWLDPDPKYPARLVEALPTALAPRDERLHWPGIDVRAFLDENPGAFDVVMLNLPDVTTLALNRYYTREFFEQVRDGLAPGGVLGVRTLGGENFMGDELVNVGASVYVTLAEVFPSLTLKPGDETWIFAADQGVLSPYPAELRDRFGGVPGAEEVYPPEGLMSLFLPDRMAYQEDVYLEAAEKAGRSRLVNTDASPQALLHSLLFAARQAGAGVNAAAWIYAFAGHGLLLLPSGLLLLMTVRCVYLTHGRRVARVSDRRVPVFDLFVLVAATGGAGMGLSLVLMYWYQALLGSIFLYVGLLSALFMAGLVLAGLLVHRLLLRRGHLALPVLAAGLALQAVFMLSLSLGLPTLTAVPFAVMFAVSGMLSGVYVPATASLLARYDIPVGRAASGIELSDHLGGALVGLGVGLLLLPVFGAAYTLRLLVLLLALLPLAWLTVLSRRGPAPAPDRMDACLRPLGYTLFAVAALTLGSSLWLHHAARPSTWELLGEAARAMADADTRLEVRTGPGALRGYRYLAELDEAGDPAALCFSDIGLCEAAPGFGGPLHLAVRIDPEGHLLGYRLVQSSETPAYVELLEGWREGITGRSIFDPDALADVDGITGATVTSEAVLQTLRRAGRVFASDVLQVTAPVEEAPSPRREPDRRAVALLALAALAFALRARPSAIGRRILLLAALAITGWLLNVQYSLAQVYALLRLSLPPPAFTAAFLLAAGLPVLVLLFGNIYCGYLCPFGALQELLGDLRPRRLDLHPGPTARRLGRSLKYGVLFVCVMLFACSLDPAESGIDPLVGVFSAARSPILLSLIGVVLIASLVLDRFWCRYLCPTGAFLSLLNGVRMFRRLRPAVRPAACGFGVRTTLDLDCLQCDRCRAITPRERARLEAPPASHARGTALLFVVALAAALYLMGQHAEQVRGRTSMEAHYGAATAGRTRAADVRRLRHMIEQGQLSDREALYYRESNENSRTPNP